MSWSKTIKEKIFRLISLILIPAFLLTNVPIAEATKGIILSGGYGTRLQEGLAKEFPSLKGSSKPLLPINGKSMLEYAMALLTQAGDVDEVIISTSGRFIEEHKTWFNSVSTTPIVINKKPDKTITGIDGNLVVIPGEIESITGTYGGKPVIIINEGEKKLGSIGGLDYVLEKKAVTSDFVVLGGDNLYTGIDLNQFIAAGKNKGKGFIGVYEVPVSLASQYGIAVTDATDKITKFQEKPLTPEISPGKTNPTASTLTYWMPNSYRQLIRDYLLEGGNPDNIGNIWPYAMEKTNDIYAYTVPPEWFDAGDIDTYKTANVVFAARGKTKAEIEAILASGKITIGKRVGGTVTEELTLTFNHRLKLVTIILEKAAAGEVTLANILTYLQKATVQDLSRHAIRELLKYESKIEAASATSLYDELDAKYTRLFKGAELEAKIRQWYTEIDNKIPGTKYDIGADTELITEMLNTVKYPNGFTEPEMEGYIIGKEMADLHAKWKAEMDKGVSGDIYKIQLGIMIVYDAILVHLALPFFIDLLARGDWGSLFATLPNLAELGIWSAFMLFAVGNLVSAGATILNANKEYGGGGLPENRYYHKTAPALLPDPSLYPTATTFTNFFLHDWETIVKPSLQELIKGRDYYNSVADPSGIDPKINIISQDPQIWWIKDKEGSNGALFLDDVKRAEVLNHYTTNGITVFSRTNFADVYFKAGQQNDLYNLLMWIEDLMKNQGKTYGQAIAQLESEGILVTEAQIKAAAQKVADYIATHPGSNTNKYWRGKFDVWYKGVFDALKDDPVFKAGQGWWIGGAPLPKYIIGDIHFRFDKLNTVNQPDGLLINAIEFVKDPTLGIAQFLTIPYEKTPTFVTKIVQPSAVSYWEAFNPIQFFYGSGSYSGHNGAMRWLTIKLKSQNNYVPSNELPEWYVKKGITRPLLYLEPYRYVGEDYALAMEICRVKVPATEEYYHLLYTTYRTFGEAVPETYEAMKVQTVKFYSSSWGLLQLWFEKIFRSDLPWYQKFQLFQTLSSYPAVPLMMGLTYMQLIMWLSGIPNLSNSMPEWMAPAGIAFGLTPAALTAAAAWAAKIKREGLAGSIRTATLKGLSSQVKNQFLAFWLFPSLFPYGATELTQVMLGLKKAKFVPTPFAPKKVQSFWKEVGSILTRYPLEIYSGDKIVAKIPFNMGIIYGGIWWGGVLYGIATGTITPEAYNSWAFRFTASFVSSWMIGPFLFNLAPMVIEKYEKFKDTRLGGMLADATAALRGARDWVRKRLGKEPETFVEYQRDANGDLKNLPAADLAQQKADEMTVLKEYLQRLSETYTAKRLSDADLTTLAEDIKVRKIKSLEQVEFEFQQQGVSLFLRTMYDEYSGLTKAEIDALFAPTGIVGQAIPQGDIDTVMNNFFSKVDTNAEFDKVFTDVFNILRGTNPTSTELANIRTAFFAEPDPVKRRAIFEDRMLAWQKQNYKDIANSIAQRYTNKGTLVEPELTNWANAIEKGEFSWEVHIQPNLNDAGLTRFIKDTFYRLMDEAPTDSIVAYYKERILNGESPDQIVIDYYEKVQDNALKVPGWDIPLFWREVDTFVEDVRIALDAGQPVPAFSGNIAAANTAKTKALNFLNMDIADRSVTPRDRLLLLTKLAQIRKFLLGNAGAWRITEEELYTLGKLDQLLANPGLMEQLVPKLDKYLPDSVLTPEALAVKNELKMSELYTFNGKTIRIIWDGKVTSGDKGIIKAGLIDNKMLLEWLGKMEFPAEPAIPTMRVYYLGQGAFKYTVKVIFEGRKPFTFGYVWNARIPNLMQAQFDEYIIPTWNYWISKVAEEDIPVPKPGGVKWVTHPFDGKEKECYTEGYLAGFYRKEFMDLLKEKLGGEESYIEALLAGREAASSYMIWVATGGRLFNDYGRTNVIFKMNKLGQYVPTYFDFDIVEYGIKTFKDLFDHVRTYISPLHGTEILIGFYNEMKIIKKTDAQIFADFDTCVSIDPAAVTNAKNIITNGRQINWAISSREDIEVGADKSAQRQAIGKILIDGNFGFIPKAFHNLFRDIEEGAVINSIDGEYLHSSNSYDYYRLALKNNVKDKSFTVAVSHNRIPDAATVRSNYEAVRSALENAVAEEEIDYELVFRRFDKRANEGKELISEEFPEHFAGWYDDLIKSGTDPYKLHRAMADSFATLYQVSQQPVTGKINCVFNNPRENKIFFIETSEGSFSAKPVDFDISGLSSLGKVLDHYFDKVSYFRENPDALLEPFYNVLLDGEEALRAATSQSANAEKISKFLNGLPLLGTIDKVLFDKGIRRTQLDYSVWLAQLWQGILGKTFTINGKPYTFPSNLDTPDNIKRFDDIFTALLGDVGPARAFSDSQVAVAMEGAIEDYGLGAVDLDMLSVIGINGEAGLKEFLNNNVFPVTTSKGYKLTPRSLLGYLLALDPPSNFASGVLDTVSSVIFMKYENGIWFTDFQPLVKLHLIESDYLLLLDLLVTHSARRIHKGVYNGNLHAQVAFGLHAVIHEDRHAYQGSYIDLWGDKQRPRNVFNIFSYPDMRRVDEGDAEFWTKKQLMKLDGLFQQDSKYNGIFKYMSLAVQKYKEYTVSVAQWYNTHPKYYIPNNYVTELEEYSTYYDLYNMLTAKENFIEAYLEFCASSRTYSPVYDFLATFKVPALLKPYKFDFQKDGNIRITTITGVTKLLSWRGFKFLYGDKTNRYIFPNGYLDFSAEGSIYYVIKGYKLKLTPPVTLFVDELGSYPFYYIYHPNMVEMYYMDPGAGLLANIEFYLSGSNMHIDMISVSKRVLDSSITAAEAARSLILSAYKLNPLAVGSQIGVKTILGADTWTALQSLIDDGYLKGLGENAGREWYGVQKSLKDAKITITKKLYPGPDTIEGTKDAPTLKHGTDPIITNGILPKNSELKAKGNDLEIKQGEKTYLIARQTLLDLVEATFGAGIREFNIKLEGTDHIISIKDNEVVSGTVTYKVSDETPFWANQVEYYENKVQKFRWETGYRSTALTIPNEFKNAYMSDISEIYITHGRKLIPSNNLIPDGRKIPITRKLYSQGIIPSDLEIAIVRGARGGVFSTVYVDYREFVQKILPTMPEAVESGVGYKLNLPMGNSIWFSKDINDPKIWGEGAMFKNFGGYSIDGVPYKKFFSLLSLPAQQFVLLPNAPLYSVSIWEIPVEDVVVNVGEINPAKFWSDSNVKMKTDMHIKFNAAGDVDEILINTPTSKMSVEPTYYRQKWNRLVNYARTPWGGAVTFGGINTIVIFLRYGYDQLSGQDNITSDMLVGDMFGNAAFMGTWYAGGLGVQHLANKVMLTGAGGLAKLGVTGVSLTIIPVSILVQSYATAWYTEWRRAEDVDAELLDVADSLMLKAAPRAWLDVLSEWGDFLHGKTFKGGPNSNNISGMVAEALWKKELEVNISRYSDLTVEEYEAAKKTFFLDNGEPYGRYYSRMYDDEIAGAIIDGLAVNMFYPYCNRYGCYAMMPAPTTLPVSANDVAAGITKAVGPLYDKLLTGDNGTYPPLESIIGAADFQNTFSLAELFGLARKEVEDIKEILETANPYYNPGPGWDTGYYVGGQIGRSIIYYSLGIPRCDEIYSLLNNADFAGLGVSASLLENPSFEDIDEEYKTVFYELTVPSSPYELSNSVVFDGVRYYWDVKANSPPPPLGAGLGKSPVSERWNFIGKD